MAGCTPASGRRRIILRPVGAARFEGEFDSELSTEDPPGYRSTQRGYPHFKEDTRGHSKRIPTFQSGHTRTLKEDTAVFDKDLSWYSRRIPENAPLNDDAGVLHTQNEKTEVQGYSST